MERSQFTFYESFFKAISRIRKKADRADAYDAIIAYALYGTEPDADKLPDAVAIVFDLIQPNLIASRRKAEGGIRGSKKKDNDKIPLSSEEDSDKIPASYDKDNGNKKKKEKENKKEDKKENKCYIPPDPPKGGLPRFSPPTVSEVSAYCSERKNSVDAENFVNFYAAKGWVVGKSPMKDWKAAVRTWEKRDRQENPGYHFDPGDEGEYV